MSEENKDAKTVRDLKPDKDVKGGTGGTEPPQPSGDGDKFHLTKGGAGPNPLPPIPGTN